MWKDTEWLVWLVWVSKAYWLMQTKNGGGNDSAVRDDNEMCSAHRGTMQKEDTASKGFWSTWCFNWLFCMRKDAEWLVWLGWDSKTYWLMQAKNGGGNDGAVSDDNEMSSSHENKRKESWQHNSNNEAQVSYGECNRIFFMQFMQFRTCLTLSRCCSYQERYCWLLYVISICWLVLRSPWLHSTCCFSAIWLSLGWLVHRLVGIGGNPIWTKVFLAYSPCAVF